MGKNGAGSGAGDALAAESLARALEDARARRGLSVAELAGRAGMAPARLWRLLRGEREMRAVELVRLCAALDVELGDLASGGEEKRE